MKLKEVRVVITEKLFVGNFETIKPSVELSGELEPGDDPAKCADELFERIQPAWAKQALKELAWVVQRRKGDSTKLHECMQLTKDTRAQLKTLL
jgi:hypothetical protein